MRAYRQAIPPVLIWALPECNLILVLYQRIATCQHFALISFATPPFQY